MIRSKTTAVFMPIAAGLGVAAGVALGLIAAHKSLADSGEQTEVAADASGFDAHLFGDAPVLADAAIDAAVASDAPDGDSQDGGVQDGGALDGGELYNDAGEQLIELTLDISPSRAVRGASIRVEGEKLDRDNPTIMVPLQTSGETKVKVTIWTKRYHYYSEYHTLTGPKETISIKLRRKRQTGPTIDLPP